MNQKNGAVAVKIISYILFVNTIIWGLAAFSPFNQISHIYLDTLYWPPGDAIPSLDTNVMWLSSIGAGLLAAIAVFYHSVVSPAVRVGNRNVIKATIVAGLSWFVVDSAGSIAAGVYHNAIFNLITLVPLIGPLLIIRYDDEAQTVTEYTA